MFRLSLVINRTNNEIETELKFSRLVLEFGTHTDFTVLFISRLTNKNPENMATWFKLVQKLSH